jgi:DNA-binding CsgD family transcriptional regulator
VTLHWTSTSPPPEATQIARIFTEIAAAGLDPGRWQFVVDALAEVGEVRAHLFGCNSVQSNTQVFLSSGYDPHFMADFLSYYAFINPLQSGFAAAAVGQAITHDAEVSYDELRRSEFHADWLKPQGDLGGGGGVVFMRDPDRNLMLGGIAERRRLGTVEDRWLALLKLVTPALAQSFDMNRRLADISLAASLGGLHSATQDTFAVVLNADRKVVMVNPAASAALSVGDFMGVDNQGRFRLTAISEVRRFTTAFEQTARLASGSRTFVAGDLSGQHRYRVQLLRFVGNGIPFAPLGPIAVDQDDLVIFVAEPMQAHQEVGPVLAKRLGLSLAEAEVANLIAEGRSAAEIADERGASMHTVRNQIKAALAKTSCRRQSELVALVAQARR